MNKTTEKLLRANAKTDKKQFVMNDDRRFCRIDPKGYRSGNLNLHIWGKN
tara:strand:+ start:82 stop:231 length:150 start_codon:yes stop_codon:yes gene_type:complete